MKEGIIIGMIFVIYVCSIIIATRVLNIDRTISKIENIALNECSILGDTMTFRTWRTTP